MRCRETSQSLVRPDNVAGNSVQTATQPVLFDVKERTSRESGAWLRGSLLQLSPLDRRTDCWERENGCQHLVASSFQVLRVTQGMSEAERAIQEEAELKVSESAGT